MAQDPKEGQIKKQIVAVSNNPTKFRKEEEMNKKLTMHLSQLDADRQYDVPPQPRTTPEFYTQGFQGTYTVCSTVTVIGTLFILYGLLT